MSLEAIKYERGSLKLLDQRLLPFEAKFLDVPDAKTSWQHIKDMVVRGAPAIGVTGALTLAIELHNSKAGGKAFASLDEALTYINTTLDYLVSSRPTAVNLKDAADKLKVVTKAAVSETGATPESVSAKVIEACEAFLPEDVAANKAMAAYGADALLAAVAAHGKGTADGKVRVLTHCNTGSLATAGYGTALGIIRMLHERGLLEHAYCTETRPYNQGARLTAFELVHDGLPATLICDSAAASLMASGRVDAVVVGADRVVANGDTANKIGTYMLSIVAAHHAVPFFIAAPTTTLDPHLPDGGHIEIEERTPEEITHFRGQQVAAKNIGIWNPAFDVAPATLIAGIATERGMIPKANNGFFKVREFMAEKGLYTPPSSDDATANGMAAAPSAQPATQSHQQAMDVLSVKRYVAGRPELLHRVGDLDSMDSWSVTEVGDGNINFVFIINGPAGGLCIKQALPFVRCVGESWPLTQERLRVEAEALQIEGRLCPEHVPAVYLYDASSHVVAMQLLPHSQFIILRKGLIEGRIYPHLAAHVSRFLATTLFGTSLLALNSAQLREQATRFENTDMCRLTEQVIFTEPYYPAANNRHTSPELDAAVAELHGDVAARTAATVLKGLFCGRRDALLHGDLHTGSLMATEQETYFIDPEFAFYGPMAFDVAKIMANLLLAYFGSFGQEVQTAAGSRSAQRDWLLASVSDIWNGFRAQFLELWSSEAASSGDLCSKDLFKLGERDSAAKDTALHAVQSRYMAQLWDETQAFMGAFFIRRTVGIAHVADLDTIADPKVRSMCELAALGFGCRLLLVISGASPSFSSVEELTAAAVQAAAQGGLNALLA